MSFIKSNVLIFIKTNQIWFQSIKTKLKDQFNQVLHANYTTGFNFCLFFNQTFYI